LRAGATAFFVVTAARFGLAAVLEADARAGFAAGAPPFAALRTGAFFPVGRLASGFGRADFVPDVRLFADDAGEALRELGREAGLLTPLMIGSLMRSYSVIKMTHEASQNAVSLTQPIRINQRNSLICGRKGGTNQVCHEATEKNSCSHLKRYVRFQMELRRLLKNRTARFKPLPFHQFKAQPTPSTPSPFRPARDRHLKS
jgi:hypothetical protein